MTTVGAACVESVDAVKQPRGSLPGEEISVRFQCCRMLGRRRALLGMPEFKVSEDPLDDPGIVNKADITWWRNSSMSC